MNQWLFRFAVLLFVFLFTACGKASPEPLAVGSVVSEIQVTVAGDDFEIGTPRLPLVLYDGTRRGAQAQGVKLTAFDLSTDPPTPGWSGRATGYTDYWIPYWVAYPELPHAGFWGFEAEITLPDGRRAKAQFTIQVHEDSLAPSNGEQPPASQNRTLETEPDLQKLTSDFDDPEPGLYQMTIAEALASGKPGVVVFATPAFCTSQLCTPVVESVKTVYRQYGDRAIFIHIEVYKTFDPLVLADEMGEWKLETEPWTFVLDREGRVAGKFSGPIGAQELAEALGELLP